MNKLVMVAGAVALAGIMMGCFTMSQEERRAAYQEEFERLKNLPPAKMVASPNQAVAGCAKLSADLFNEIQPMMKAYVEKVETSREFTGFMNDIQYYVEEEKMSKEAACKKVVDDVVAADANLPEDQKVWPKIQRGISAVNELDPKKQLVQIGVLAARNRDIEKSVSSLKGSFANEDFANKIKRGAECASISEQSKDSAECLVYLGDQYSRVIELENYAR